MKTSELIGKNVKHIFANTDGPNFVGTILNIRNTSEGEFADVKFRDFTEVYSVGYCQNNLI